MNVQVIWNVLSTTKKKKDNHLPTAPHVNSRSVSLFPQQQLRGAVPQCDHFIGVWSTGEAGVFITDVLKLKSWANKVRLKIKTIVPRTQDSPLFRIVESSESKVCQLDLTSD